MQKKGQFYVVAPLSLRNGSHACQKETQIIGKQRHLVPLAKLDIILILSIRF